MPIWSDAFSGYSNYRLDWLWSTVRQETENNRSLIHRKLSITRTGGSGTARLNSDSTWATTGGPSRSGDFSYDFRNYTTLVLLDEEVWITHDSDGTLSVSTTARADTVSGTPLGDALITAKTVTSPTIPRATVPELRIGSTKVTSFDAGTALTVFLNRASSSFTHDVSFTFGSASGTIATGAGVSASWTPPLSLLSEIPNATSGSGKLKAVTKNGSTVVGTKEITFTLRADASVVPFVTAINAVDDNPDVASLIGAYVQGQSRLKATVVASGAYGSTISASKVTVDGQTVDSGQSVPLPTSGTRVVAAAVTDSRGRTGSATGNVTVLPYDKPQINNFFVERATSSGTPSPTGTYLRMTLNASASSLVVGSQKNSMTVRVFTRPRGSTAWTARNVIVSMLSYDTSVLITGGGVYAANTAYDVRVEVSDKLQTSQDFWAVSTAGAIVDATATKQAFGKMVEASGPVSQMQGPGRLYDAWDVDGRKILDTGDFATSAETIAGIESSKAITPAGLKAAFPDTGWVDVDLKSGFAPQSTAERPQVRLEDGRVSIKGGWSSAGISASGTFTAGVIPLGFRPAQTMFGRCGTSVGAADASVLVTASGDVQLRTNGTLSAYYFPVIPEWRPVDAP